jgi:tetratricopeptide (TPR) repeat protein
MKTGGRRVRPLCLLAAIVLLAAVARGGQTPMTLDTFERAIAASPEDLRLAADYRQLAIEQKQFDRSIDFLDRLADRRGSGPNIKLSLALAYVDKVPTVGDFRKLYLGRDAINAVSRSIEQRPTMLAYYVRGLINIYYNNFIFHRVPRGIEDFTKALSFATAATSPLALWHIYVSLGDAYWRLEDRQAAREAWKKGLSLVPDASELAKRVNGDEKTVEKIVDRALDPDNRVDTSLRGVDLPEVLNFKP